MAQKGANLTNEEITSSVKEKPGKWVISRDCRAATQGSYEFNLSGANSPETPEFSRILGASESVFTWMHSELFDIIIEKST